MNPLFAVGAALASTFTVSVFAELETVLLNAPFSGSTTGPVSEAQLNASTTGGTWSVVTPAESEILGSDFEAPGLLAGWDFTNGAKPSHTSDGLSGSFDLSNNTDNGSKDGTWGSLSTAPLPNTSGLNCNKITLTASIDVTLTVPTDYLVELSTLNFDWLDAYNSRNGLTVTYLSGDLTGVTNGTVLYSVSSPADKANDVDVDLTAVLSDVTLASDEQITLRFALSGGSTSANFLDNVAVFGRFMALNDRALSARTGPFDLRLNLDEPWINDEKTTLNLSVKLAALDHNNGEILSISGLDSSSNTLFTVTYDNSRAMGALDSEGTFFPAGTGWNDKVKDVDAFDPDDLRTVIVELKSSGLNLHVDGSANELSDFPYHIADPANLATLVITGESNTEAFIDDILLVSEMAVAETGPLSDVSGLWVTDPDGVQIVERKADVAFQQGAGSNSLYVDIDTTERYQPIDGFGASMTDASAILIYNSPHRDEIMDQLFNPDTGIGMALVRFPMGACDFSDHVWSYEDTQGSFNIDYDLTMRIPLLKQALEMNPQLKLMGSPWSAPAWMKSNGSMRHGSLKPEFVDDYAQYFVNFVKAYEAQGLPIWAITVQNEPQHGNNQYPTMKMTPAEHIALTKAIGAAFAANNISTKIIVFDHNYNIGEDYVNEVYADQEAYDYAAGSAWHQYGGDASSMGNIRRDYPEKGLYFTERTGEKRPFSDNMHYFFNDIFFNALYNGARCVLTWNIAVDENGGPNLPSVTWNTAAGLIDYDTTDDSWTLYPEYAAIGHYGRFVRPGAIRIDAAPSNKNLQTLAFKNTDGTIAVIVYNNTGDEATFDLKIGDKHLTSTLARRNAATFLFHELDDLDGNGLSDRWELKYFNDWGIDPEADSDGDGADNGSEYKAGTDPTDPNNKLSISLIGTPKEGKIKVTPASRSDFRSWHRNQHRLGQMDTLRRLRGFQHLHLRGV
ncbi:MULTISPECIES: glycoside hydrolase family 30 beta sandwich domain-containing protein [unclassified Lentimonas]|uniref:glycoside hydrolase family 30 beta sandwich domain-containing protein n=1 Tax=unclassified Lentimonas TaxID=2630993 RepID=UPI001389B3F3|nr:MULTISPECIES: glycoside hydrolase family 30 beta sandwich domain-containing protein [unclassified Lentimonas]